jgi:hypothetical protein
MDRSSLSQSNYMNESISDDHVHSYVFNCNTICFACKIGEIKHSSLDRPIIVGDWPTSFCNVCAAGPLLCCAGFCCPYVVAIPDAFSTRKIGNTRPGRDHQIWSCCCILSCCQFPHTAFFNCCFLRPSVIVGNKIVTTEKCCSCSSCCCLPCALIQQRILTAHKVCKNGTLFLYLSLFYRSIP